MTFSEQLNKYIKQIECSSKDLVISSGLTSSVISRYRRGDRTPSLKSKQLEQLTDGLYKLSLTREISTPFSLSLLSSDFPSVPTHPA